MNHLVSSSDPPNHSYFPPSHPHTNHNHNFDPTGQIPPPGAKPRVTATLWEDEGSLCFHIEVRGVCVARREDNHMINGTKLLNVAGMTRGRRDGILKSEKIRHVVKIGPMHLKGVWIPFERALDFANKEKITHLLYPLFVHDIGALLYPNHSRPLLAPPLSPPLHEKLDSRDTSGHRYSLSIPSSPHTAVLPSHSPPPNLLPPPHGVASPHDSDRLPFAWSATRNPLVPVTALLPPPVRSAPTPANPTDVKSYPRTSDPPPPNLESHPLKQNNFVSLSPDCALFPPPPPSLSSDHQHLSIQSTPASYHASLPPPSPTLNAYHQQQQQQPPPLPPPPPPAQHAHHGQGHGHHHHHPSIYNESHNIHSPTSFETANSTPRASYSLPNVPNLHTNIHTPFPTHSVNDTSQSYQISLPPHTATAYLPPPSTIHDSSPSILTPLSTGLPVYPQPPAPLQPSSQPQSQQQSLHPPPPPPPPGPPQQQPSHQGPLPPVSASSNLYTVLTPEPAPSTLMAPRLSLSGPTYSAPLSPPPSSSSAHAYSLATKLPHISSSPLLSSSSSLHLVTPPPPSCGQHRGSGIPGSIPSLSTASSNSGPASLPLSSPTSFTSVSSPTTQCTNAAAALLASNNANPLHLAPSLPPPPPAPPSSTQCVNSVIVSSTKVSNKRRREEANLSADIQETGAPYSASSIYSCHSFNNEGINSTISGATSNNNTSDTSSGGDPDIANDSKARCIKRRRMSFVNSDEKTANVQPPPPPPSFMNSSNGTNVAVAVGNSSNGGIPTSPRDKYLIFPSIGSTGFVGDGGRQMNGLEIPMSATTASPMAPIYAGLSGDTSVSSASSFCSSASSFSSHSLLSSPPSSSPHSTSKHSHSSRSSLSSASSHSTATTIRRA